MSESLDDDGFLHEHGKELIIGGVAALSMMGIAFAIAKHRLNEKAVKEPQEPTDNS
jgi:hypothetical protein